MCVTQRARERERDSLGKSTKVHFFGILAGFSLQHVSLWMHQELRWWKKLYWWSICLLVKPGDNSDSMLAAHFTSAAKTSSTWAKVLAGKGHTRLPWTKDLCSADNSISPQLIKRADWQFDLQILGSMFSHSPMGPHFKYTILKGSHL
jgi:hypothetical protein